MLDAKAIGASVPRLPSGIVVGGLVWRFNLPRNVGFGRLALVSHLAHAAVSAGVGIKPFVCLRSCNSHSSSFLKPDSDATFWKHY